MQPSYTHQFNIQEQQVNVRRRGTRAKRTKHKGGEENRGQACVLNVPDEERIRSRYCDVYLPFFLSSLFCPFILFYVEPFASFGAKTITITLLFSAKVLSIVDNIKAG